MKLLWTEQSLVRLKTVKSYLTRQASEKVATAYIKKLIKRAEALIEFPEMGRSVPEINSPHIRELIEGHYRIVYRLTQEKIEILTVFEGHKGLEKIQLDE
jgi:toxin ParE1/3/4